MFSSTQFRAWKPRNAVHSREEMFLAEADATRFGVSPAGEYGILSIEPQFPGPAVKRLAARILPDAAVPAGEIHLNRGFLETAELLPDDPRTWTFERSASRAISEAVFRVAVEQTGVAREVDALRRMRKELFVGRCLLTDSGQQTGELRLPVGGRGLFYFESIEPAPEALREPTVLYIDERSSLNLFVPHQKSGVDMAILVDVSNSMELRDYLGEDGKAKSRLEGVRLALERLLERRLVEGSRVSRIAALVFGGGTRMLYPLDKSMVELTDQARIQEMRESTRNLSRVGLERMGVDRMHTDISSALKESAELLDYYGQEGNEKLVVLLSDGADWKEETDENKGEEIVNTSHDPAVLSDSLHNDSEIRFFTVAVSNAENLRKYEDHKYWSERWAIPNTALLRKIAGASDGIFLEKPDAIELKSLFDAIGRGVWYELSR